MSLTINTNAAAVTASYNLSHNNAALQKSLSRLSSGKRIVKTWMLTSQMQDLCPFRQRSWAASDKSCLDEPGARSRSYKDATEIHSHAKRKTKGEQNPKPHAQVGAPLRVNSQLVQTTE